MPQRKRPKDIVRTDKWRLAPSHKQRHLLLNTVTEFRYLCRALLGVIYTHWLEIAPLRSKQRVGAVEKLIHKTQHNQHPKYNYFGRRFYKFPSYYRRSAINFAVGQVSSFVTRSSQWQQGIRKRKDAKPPRLKSDTNCYPALYQGQCILFGVALTNAKIKVFTGSDWVWTDIPIRIDSGSKRHLIEGNEKMSPFLIVNQKSCHLSVPFKCFPYPLPESERVISVDLGINTTAVATVVTSSGTVLDRHFIHPGRDIDRRDQRLKRISKKASLSNGKLHKGFCRGLYRKAGNINRQIAHSVSREIVEMAAQWEASVIVLENMKGWKPRGGKKRSTLKQRFHGWLHRRIAEYTEMKWTEVGGTVFYVNPAYTSKYAYDGSGQVKRDPKNYADCVFPSGKRYNSDLNGSQNIGAKYWLTHKRSEARTSRSSGRAPRSRAVVTLSTLWNLNPIVVGIDTAS